MQRATTILAYLLLLCEISFSQQYPFVHYTPREGLANNRTRMIYQDSKGKLYIATYAGLSIYDGSRFVNFNFNNGLAIDLVNDIVEMGDDSIMIFPNAKAVHTLVRGKLTNFITADNFTPLINQVIKCSDGYYYALGDEGLFRIQNKQFVKVRLDGIPSEQARTFTQAIEVDKRLYVFSNPDYKKSYSNLLTYDLRDNKVLGYDTTIKGIALFKPSTEQVWISSVNGMLMLDKKIGVNKAPAFKPLPDSLGIPRNLFPHQMFKDRQSNIWMACMEGVYKVSKRGQLTVFTVENGLTTNNQSSVFQDNENNIWFTNGQTGLTKLSNQELVYYPEYKPGHAPIDIFVRQSSDSVWVYDGVHREVMLVLPNGKTEYYKTHDSIFSHANFVSANGHYLLNGHTIYKWKPDPLTKSYSISLTFRDSIIGQSGFNRGLSDKYGNLVTVSDRLVVLSGNKVLSASVHYMADQLAIDNENRVWVATRSDELFCFQITGTGKTSNLSLLKYVDNIVIGSPRSITVDKSGNVWIGTRGEGVYCLQFDGLKIRSVSQLTSINGLSDNFVSYLFCDSDNNIWACSPSGLDRITADRGSYFVENVTRSSNLYLPVLKIQQTAKGLFWILTTQGLITYAPARRDKINWKPSLQFSNVIISNARKQTLTTGGSLKHFQNNLVFQLSAPSFVDEKQTRFSYLLEGSDKEWSEPSAEASINFVNLPPGTYSLKAKAIFLHGLYPDAESSFTFTILPPWWKTWWFRMLGGIVLVSLLILTLRFYYNRKLEMQMAVLEKRRALEKERTRIATDMHDDLGAGLSQIKFLSETIGMKKQKHLPIEDEIGSIRSFSEEMIDKMGEIVWALNEKNDTLNDLLSYTRSHAMEYLEQNGIECKFFEPDNIPSDCYVSSDFRRNIYLTVKETLHNVVKHAQATEVIIKVGIDKLLTIEIRDNGIGIDKTTKRQFSNGIINMNKRIRELNGSIDIVAETGTVVRIQVPLAPYVNNKT